MKRVRYWALAVLAVSTLAATGDAPAIKSGLQPGEFTTPFDVYDVTGPNKGTSLCYR